MAEHTYKEAGVDLDAAAAVKRRIEAIAAPTRGPQVLSGAGGFGAMYRLAGFREPVLVASTDGVGTKLKLAAAMHRYGTIGEDLVSACVNDVIVSGAKPLFFLDYIAVGVLEVEAVEAMLKGMARACVEVECALVGGETAQMPGLYGEGEFDVAGFAVGAVEKSDILDGSSVAEGDVLLGIPSSGLHTNGYSLVRDILRLDDDPSPLGEYYSELDGTLGDALLAPHRSYYRVVRHAVPLVKAMAHITGGGLVENVPRALPEGLGARFDTASWRAPAIFHLLQEMGNISRDEMFRVFNMGLGFVVVCDRSKVAEIVGLVPEASVVGEVVRHTDGERVVL
ncbi:MAG: phosphoribosylformylglycinamidine cyclo-ligase [Chloroflexi bacterium]|nr:phosphoribosylformylglycinamidine cyclo-ligase [Chloroflexota bacterium]